jgi:hypothetical protein
VQHLWHRRLEDLKKGGRAPDHHKGVPQTPTLKKGLGDAGRGLLPESIYSKKRTGKGAFQGGARLDPTVFNLGTFRAGAQDDDIMRPAPGDHEGQANRGDEVQLFRIVVIGREEPNNRVFSKAGNSEKTVNERCRRTFVGRLNNHE